MENSYEQNGFLHVRGCFAPSELAPVREIIQRYHAGWLKRNKHHYEEGGVVNSAYLTDHKTMPAADRAVMFALINSPKLLNLLAPLMPNGIAFMNTQLFFGPWDPDKKNYWHRDIQYTGMSVAEQQAEMAVVNVIHCRIVLLDEPGLELVSGTHKHWDADEEFETRMGTNGRKVYDDLPGADTVNLREGDLLLFSANMIHRGLYASDRLALDIVYCDPLPRLLAYAEEDCMPNQLELKNLDPASPLAVAANAKLSQKIS